MVWAWRAVGLSSILHPLPSVISMVQKTVEKVVVGVDFGEGVLGLVV